MYIKNGIAYAGEQEPSIRVNGVRPLDDYMLWMRFSNGEERMLDCKPLLRDPAFAPLADMAVFRGVYIDYGLPVWMDGEIDISPEYVFGESTLQSVTSA